jgi:hypothetical protein
MKTYLDTFVILDERKGKKQVVVRTKKSNQMMCMC